MQKGFSPLIVVIVLMLISAGGVWWFMGQGATSTDTTNSEDSATTTPGATESKTANKSNGSFKTKVNACDLLSVSKVSSITGVPMKWVKEDQEPYEDAEIWNSICSFEQVNGTVESNAGVFLMITEGLSGESKAYMADLFEESRVAAGGITITGFGDKAYKVLDVEGGIGPNSYNVLIGDMTIEAHSTVGHGSALHEFYSEKKDDQTEAILKHVLSQLK